MRLLADTCAAIKLAAFGDKLFRPGVLSNGDLVLHPRVLAETRKWHPDKKEKYKAELALLSKIKATSGLRPPRDEFQNLESLIFSTMDEISSPIGSADRDQLISAIHNGMEIVTNDTPFANVAEAVEVRVHSAERIVIEAHSQKILSNTEVIAARTTWESNDEKRPTREEKKELDAICK